MRKKPQTLAQFIPSYHGKSQTNQRPIVKFFLRSLGRKDFVSFNHFVSFA
jgi:hypothetical protein